jgi:hypothetical protein
LALQLGQLETECRALTRHKVDARVTTTDLYALANAAYRELRSELQEIAPELYLRTGDVVTFEDLDTALGEYNEIVLSDTDFNFDNVFSVERQCEDGRWRGIERASQMTPDESVHGRIGFTVQHRCLRLHPDGKTGGNYRVVSHVVPPVLDDAAAYFQIPSQLEMPLKYRTCGLMHLEDGDGPDAHAKWYKLAADQIARVTPSLKKQHGIHPVTSGIRRVMRR